MKKFDIIISGGGMIGSIAAVAATVAGFSVLLVESNRVKNLNIPSPRDLRVSAISWANICTLKKLNIFDKLLIDRVQEYTAMNVWDNRSKAHIEFEANFSQQQCLGYLIENINLVQAAWEQLQSQSHCETLQESTIKLVENEGSQVRIELHDGSLYKTRLLIAAEGRNSSVRQMTGIKCQQRSYHQKGLVAYIKLGKAPKQTALQAFNNGGPIGVLPISDGMFSIVWSLPELNCNHWLNCDKNEFEQGVKSAIGKDFGEVELVSERAAFPLSQLNAKQYFNRRVVLVGDSAHGVHPLAGQGVNLGIEDIELLFYVLDMKILKDNDLLNLALRKYQRRRISKVTETSEMMNMLHHLFKDDAHIKKPLRSLGLNLLNNSPLKKWFIQQAGS